MSPVTNPHKELVSPIKDFNAPDLLEMTREGPFLPNEIWVKLFSIFFSIKELFTLSRVNKSWHCVTLISINHRNRVALQWYFTFFKNQFPRSGVSPNKWINWEERFHNQCEIDKQLFNGKVATLPPRLVDFPESVWTGLQNNIFMVENYLVVSGSHKPPALAAPEDYVVYLFGSNGMRGVIQPKKDVVDEAKISRDKIALVHEESDGRQIITISTLLASQPEKVKQRTLNFPSDLTDRVFFEETILFTKFYRLEKEKEFLLYVNRVSIIDWKIDIIQIKLPSDDNVIFEASTRTHLVASVRRKDDKDICYIVDLEKKSCLPPLEYTFLRMHNQTILLGDESGQVLVFNLNTPNESPKPLFELNECRSVHMTHDTYYFVDEKQLHTYTIATQERLSFDLLDSNSSLAIRDCQFIRVTKRIILFSLRLLNTEDEDTAPIEQVRIYFYSDKHKKIILRAQLPDSHFVYYNEDYLTSVKIEDESKKGFKHPHHISTYRFGNPSEGKKFYLTDIIEIFDPTAKKKE